MNVVAVCDELIIHDLQPGISAKNENSNQLFIATRRRRKKKRENRCYSSLILCLVSSQSSHAASYTQVTNSSLEREAREGKEERKRNCDYTIGSYHKLCFSSFAHLYLGRDSCCSMAHPQMVHEILLKLRRVVSNNLVWALAKELHLPLMALRCQMTLETVFIAALFLAQLAVPTQFLEALLCSISSNSQTQSLRYVYTYLSACVNSRGFTNYLGFDTICNRLWGQKPLRLSHCG